jgi:hypothetical protein
MHTLDHVQAGPESKIQEEQVKEYLVVHNHQVASMLTLLSSGQAPVHLTMLLVF